MTYEELAAEEILALPERELLEPLTIVAPTQLVAALNLAFIQTDDVEGDVVVAQYNDVEAYQNTYAEIYNDD
jgi:hypothetical protein